MKWKNFLESPAGENLLHSIKSNDNTYGFMIVRDDDPAFSDPNDKELYKCRFHLVLRQKGTGGTASYIDATPALAKCPHIQFTTITFDDLNEAIPAIFDDIEGPIADAIKYSVLDTLRQMPDQERNTKIQVIEPPKA